MRALLFFDQIQAGKGGKEHTDTPLAVEKGGLGSYTMFDKYFKQEGLVLIATMYAGFDFYSAHREACIGKVINLIQKVKAEVVVCGPTYDFSQYTEMAADLAYAITTQSECKAVVCCAQEKNQATIDAFKDKITMIKMPKKGGVGLNESLHRMVEIAKCVGANESLEAFESFIY